MIRESKRTNVQYRPFALACLGDFVVIRKESDWFQQVRNITEPIIEALVSVDDEMDVDSKTGGSSSKTLYVNLLRCRRSCTVLSLLQVETQRLQAPHGLC